MGKTVAIVASIVVLAGLGIFLFMGNGGEDTATSTTEMSQTQTESEDNRADESEGNEAREPADESNEQAADEQAADELNMTIDMRSFRFSQSQISAEPGQTVNIELTNSGGTHNFTIDELDVASDTTNTGETTSVSFTIPEDAAGETYSFYCAVSNHRELGMEGQLVISS